MCCWRPLPTYARPVVHMSRKHMACMQWARSIGVANKTHNLWCSWGLPMESKHNEASFSPISTNSLCLHIPTSRDLAIFVSTTTTTTTTTTITTDVQTNHFTPCACTRGKHAQGVGQLTSPFTVEPWLSEPHLSSTSIIQTCSTQLNILMCIHRGCDQLLFGGVATVDEELGACRDLPRPKPTDLCTVQREIFAGAKFRRVTTQAFSDPGRPYLLSAN